MGSSVVLYTWMVRGHLHPMTQLADQLAGHGVPVTVAVADVPSTGDSSRTIARLSASYPSVSFHLLPPAAARPTDAADPNADPFITLIADLRATNAGLLAFLRSLPSVKALVADFFCAYGLDAAAELGVPAYVFFTLCASALATCERGEGVWLCTSVMHPAVSFGEMGRSLLHFPGVHPIPASDLPEALLDRDNRQYSTILGLFEQLPRATGILSNTFDWLEPRAVKAIKAGTPRPGESVPKLFCVGPLIGEERGSNAAEHECLGWLDRQPAESVVFLCFGSASSVPAEQLKEIAVGLERSGHAFLWAVRAPVAPDADSTKRFEGREEGTVEALLPEGFVDRTRGRGMVVSSWAPQVEVLRHPATGAFVTHCGWNSTMEAVRSGVPMLCWPMYAEQRMNKVFVVEDMKLGVAMDGYDEAVVKAGEVEAKVRLLMETEQGKEIRERTRLAKQMAAEALEAGGSSTEALADFLNSLSISTHH